MSMSFLIAVFMGHIIYDSFVYGTKTTRTDASNYGFWVENKEIWAFDYCMYRLYNFVNVYRNVLDEYYKVTY